MKYIEVKSCHFCPHRDDLFNTVDSEWYIACINSNLLKHDFPKKIENIDEIPEWCPLPYIELL